MEWQLLEGIWSVFSNLLLKPEFCPLGHEGGDKYMHIVVTHLGFKGVQNAKLGVMKSPYYAAKVQHQDLEELFSVMCDVPDNNRRTHFVSPHCVLHVGHLSLSWGCFISV